MKRTLCMILVVFMMISMAACGGTTPAATATPAATTAAPATTAEATATPATDAPATGDKPLLTYTVYMGADIAQALAAVPNDVVTPYIEKKFNIKVGKIIPSSNQSFEERLAMWIASKDEPDVFAVSGGGSTSLIKAGMVAQLDDYLPSMTNFNKWWLPDDWKYLRVDGKIYEIPKIEINTNDPKYADDPWTMPNVAHCMWVREDLLAKTGYKFETLASIAARTTQKGIKPSLEDFKITPALDSPEAYYQFLEKVKALKLVVDGKPMIPFSPVAWHLWHFGNNFGFGQWELYNDSSVAFSVGSPGAKGYFQWIKKANDAELIDRDFLIQTDADLQSKVASGRVASGVFINDRQAANAALQKINPEAGIRYIAWPKDDPNHGFYDCWTPFFNRILINKNFKDIPRLVEYFDWFSSDEGIDTITWGPEGSGVWEMKGDKRVFISADTAKQALTGEKGKMGADYYGLWDDSASGTSIQYYSVAAMAAPTFENYNPRAYSRSYPPNLDILQVSKHLLGAKGMSYTSKAAYGAPGSDACNAAGGYFWVDFLGSDIAKLLTSKDDTAFNAAWDTVMTNFNDKGQYKKAQEDEKVYFDMLNGK